MTETTTPLDDLKTPLYAVIGAGDFAIQAIGEAIESVTSAVSGARTDFGAKFDEARTKAQETVTKVADELPKDVDGLKAKFTADEFKKTADTYIAAATEVYENLAERGEEAFGKFRAQPAVEEQLEKVTNAYNNAVGITESSLGQVAAKTREVGERAAKLTKSGTASAEPETAPDTAPVVEGTTEP